jgi:hypothetical protein
LGEGCGHTLDALHDLTHLSGGLVSEFDSVGFDLDLTALAQAVLVVGSNPEGRQDSQSDQQQQPNRQGHGTHPWDGGNSGAGVSGSWTIIEG